jgi:hypothetical protein
VKQRRSSPWFLALVLAAGCSAGGAGRTVPAPDAAPLAPQAAQPAIPSESSAARHILGGVASGARQTLSRGDDDSGKDDLALPALLPCAGGALATDCAAWRLGTPPVVDRFGHVHPGSGPPNLNLCRDASLFPGDLDNRVPGPAGIGPQTFAVAYLGSKPAPVASFATHWRQVRLSGTFAGNATSAPAVTLTPTDVTHGYRGWLVFFTWSWPADVLLVPYAVNEIQLAATSAPLTIPLGGSADAGAFDCLGRPIQASATDDLSFNAAGSRHSLTTAGSELNAPVYALRNGDGQLTLADDRGARTTVPVVLGAPAP